MGFEDYLSSSSSFASSPPRRLQRPLLSVVSNVLSSTSSPSATSGHDSCAQVSSKRALEVEENSGVHKKQKTDQNIEEEMVADLSQCYDHLKEIERLKLEQQKVSEQCCDHLKEIEGLKQQLKNKEFEILTLNKIVSKYQGGKKKGKCEWRCSFCSLRRHNLFLSPPVRFLRLARIIYDIHGGSIENLHHMPLAFVTAGSPG
ncbi:unnamed protein product [Prunus armeniaca]|uniref:Uncharacterized protein n=1 Tax=Prunus armeniaca TaxID=36596 RepID=A0A6J5XKX5_PRUAR|nr:unnamed protein product [Prunus armeniaca]